MRLTLTTLALFSLALPVQADLLKCIEPGGKVTYSERKEPGMTCTPVTAEITVVPALPATQPALRPPVNPQVAQREALEATIKAQTAALAEAKKQLVEQEGIRLQREIFYQSVLDRLKPFQEKVAEAEKTLAETRKELSNFK